MPRPQKNELASKDLHRSVQKVMRKRHLSNVTAKDIELWAYANLGIRTTDVTIGKVLNGTADPAGCSLEVLIAVTAYLGAAPSEMGSVAEQRLTAAGRFFQPSGPSHQGIPASRWTTGTAERHLRVVGE